MTKNAVTKGIERKLWLRIASKYYSQVLVDLVNYHSLVIMPGLRQQADYRKQINITRTLAYRMRYNDLKPVNGEALTINNGIGWMTIEI